MTLIIMTILEIRIWHGDMFGRWRNNPSQDYIFHAARMGPIAFKLDVLDVLNIFLAFLTLWLRS